MPTETRIAARNPQGGELYYQQATIPSVEVVRAYEQFHPGAAKIMLDMAVAEQNAEIETRRINVRLEFVTRILGMVFAFFLTGALIVAGAFLLYFDHSIAGGFALFTGLVGIVACLATGGKSDASPSK